MRRTGVAWVAIVTAFTLAGCSGPDTTKTTSSEQPGRPAPVGTGGAGANLKSDGDFVHDVAIKNTAEIELSRMALHKATSPDIRTFAQRMVDDHGAAGGKLKSVVSEHHLEWPAQLDEKHTETAGELAAKQGAEFDRDYLQAMIDGHQDLAAILESRLDVQSLADWKTAAAARTQSKALPEPEVAMRDVEVRPAKADSETRRKINQWAADTYPIVQKHLDTARTLENATKRRSTN
jgi:putative membrane protein